MRSSCGLTLSPITPHLTSNSLSLNLAPNSDFSAAISPVLGSIPGSGLTPCSSLLCQARHLTVYFLIPCSTSPFNNTAHSGGTALALDHMLNFHAWNLPLILSLPGSLLVIRSLFFFKSFSVVARHGIPTTHWTCLL